MKKAYLFLFFTVMGFVAQAQTVPVVVNKMYNSGANNGVGDVVELLVVKDGLDLTGYWIKDFSSSNTGDGGGKYQFLNVAPFNNLKAGTLIVLRTDSSTADVTYTDCNDFTLDVGMMKSAYFTHAATGTFDIATTEMVMVKMGGYAGVDSNISTLRCGATSTLSNSITTGYQVGNATSTIGTGKYGYVNNATATLTDYSGTGVTVLTGVPTWAAANDSANGVFINYLRGPVSTAGSSIANTGFNANWNSLTNATSYILDVATDAAFTNFVSGYDSVNVGNVTTYAVTGLSSGTNYYYRIRAVDGEPIISGKSCTQTVTTTAPATYLSVTGNPSSVAACAGTTVTFTAQASGSPAPTVKWQVSVDSGASWTDITNATDTSLTVTAASSDNGYEYRAVFTNTTSVNTTAATLTITPATSIATAPMSHAACAQTSTNFTVAATGSNLTYQWQVNTGSGFTNVANNTTYSGATTDTLHLNGLTTGMSGYTFQCIVSGTCTPSVTSDTAALTVNSQPSVSVQPMNMSVCDSGNTYAAVVAAGTSLTYQWQANTGSGYVNIVDNGVYAGTQTDTLRLNGVDMTMNGYTYQCIVTGTCATVTTMADTLKVNALPVATITASATSFCPTDSVVLMAMPAGLTTYQWLFNNAPLTPTIADSLQVNAAGSYGVIVTDANGCNGKSNTVALVHLAVPSDSIVASGALGFCQGDSVTLSVNGNLGATYSWMKDGMSVNVTDSMLTATSSGTYTVIVSNGNCAATSAPVVVTEDMTAAPVITPDASMSGMLCATSGFATYQWYMGGNAIGGDTTACIMVTDTGAYTVMAITATGCTKTSAAFDYLSVANVNATKNAVKMYPNPAANALHIEAPMAVQITIADLAGKIIMRTKNTNDIDISVLSNGMYLVTISDANGIVIDTRKLVKNNL